MIDVNEIIEGKRPIYSLDQYFEEVVTLKGIPVVNEFYDLEGLVDHYVEVLREAPNIIDYGFENYSQIIYMDKELKSYYTVSWNLSKVHDYIKRNKMTPTTLKVSELEINCHPKDIHIDYADSLERTDPIIVVNYAPMHRRIIIDGNHRLTKAKRQNQSTISAYFFNHDSHLEIMAGDIFRNLYKIHFNLWQVLNFIAGYRNDALFLYDFPEVRRKERIQRFYDVLVEFHEDLVEQLGHEERLTQCIGAIRKEFHDMFSDDIEASKLLPTVFIRSFS